MVHEFHAWVGLDESLTGEDDPVDLDATIAEMQELVEDFKWHDATFDVINLNGQHFFRADGYVNRWRDEGQRLEEFLDIIIRKLPGAWGLIYERDDEMPSPPGSNGFRVRVLARGKLETRLDPFLSPCNPVIED